MLYDISPPISSRLPVWPGDTPPSREVLLDMARGEHLTLSTLRSTVHVGAHADAPSHYGHPAPSIDAVDLESYIGRCQVVRVDLQPGALVTPSIFAGPIDAPRVLLHTGSVCADRPFDAGFAALAPELVDLLVDRGVRLVGIDTPSIDPFESKDLPAHRACLRRGLLILEGLVLSGVPEGIYELIALPLKLVGFDASPVRAILRSLGPAGDQEPAATSRQTLSAPAGSRAC